MTRRSAIRHKYLELRAYAFAHIANRMFVNKHTGKADTAEGSNNDQHANARGKG